MSEAWKQMQEELKREEIRRQIRYERERMETPIYSQDDLDEYIKEAKQEQRKKDAAIILTRQFDCPVNATQINFNLILKELAQAIEKGED